MKPENIFLTERDGRRDFVKIVDFGIAKMSDIETEGAPGRKLTKTGMIFGTPEYMSPEQAAAEELDHRVDGYALGGEGGLRTGGSLDTRTMVAWNRLAIDGRVYGVYFQDEITQARRGYSLAVQAGLNVQLWRGIHLNLLGEELMTNYYTSALRLLASLTVDWSLRTSTQR